MKCIILEGPAGRRLVHEGKAYTLLVGEVVKGVDPTCAGTVSQLKPVTGMQQLQNELDLAIGGGVGDWMKVLASPVAKLLGREGCSACEARRLVMNAYAQLKQKHGQLEAMKIIKQLWQLSIQSTGEAVLLELKKHLA